MITLVEGGFLTCCSISKLDRASMASTIIGSLRKTFVLMLYRRTMKLRLKNATSPVVGRAGKMAEKLILETSLKSPAILVEYGKSRRAGAPIYSTDRAVAWLARTQSVARLRALGLAGMTGEQCKACNCDNRMVYFLIIG